MNRERRSARRRVAEVEPATALLCDLLEANLPPVHFRYFSNIACYAQALCVASSSRCQRLLRSHEASHTPWLSVWNYPAPRAPLRAYGRFFLSLSKNKVMFSKCVAQIPCPTTNLNFDIFILLRVCA